MQEAADFYSHQLKHNKQVLNYLEKRGFDNDIIKHFKLGYAPQSFPFITLFNGRYQI
ncbi:MULTISPECIES: hypothetical protein [Candidatus Phytoplasma]|uniref:hypothetical protein n=1 Tax=Candidatus Phytoplasma TaxID=33926 RepID=UPI000AD764AE|nr:MULTISPECIES: hypothetical protein [Phytoplasma]